MTTRTNPYTRLKQTAREFAFKILYPRRQQAWIYKNTVERGTWDLNKLHWMIFAASRTDWDVVLKLSNDGKDIVVWFVESRPEDLPFELED